MCRREKSSNVASLSRTAALPYMQRAIALDPNFASPDGQDSQAISRPGYGPASVEIAPRVGKKKLDKVLGKKQTNLDLRMRSLEVWKCVGDERQITGMNMKITSTATPLELSRERSFSSENANILDSWKEIANYLNRNVRTVQRWEAVEFMPVHRQFHAKSGSVHAFRLELDAWRQSEAIAVLPVVVKLGLHNVLKSV